MPGSSLTWSSTAKIIHLSGNLQQFKQPIKTGHIISQNPNYFLCSSDSMLIDAHVPQVPEDELTVWIQTQQCLCLCWRFLCGFRALFKRPSNMDFSKFFFKIESHVTIHTFKNYFVTVFLVFNNKRYPNKPEELQLGEIYFLMPLSQSHKQGWSQEFLFGGPSCSTNIFINISPPPTYIHMYFYYIYTHFFIW